MTWEKLKKMANAYLPQWHPDRDNPDIGSVIALLYMEMQEKNMQRYREMPERARREVLKRAGIQPLQAQPARTILTAALGV